MTHTLVPIVVTIPVDVATLTRLYGQRGNGPISTVAHLIAAALGENPEIDRLTTAGAVGDWTIAEPSDGPARATTGGVR